MAPETQPIRPEPPVQCPLLPDNSQATHDGVGQENVPATVAVPSLLANRKRTDVTSRIVAVAIDHSTIMRGGSRVSEQVNRGIYDDFHGYRLPTEDELNTALQSALVVLDTNVLLNLYRYSKSTRNDLLGVMRSLGERLWVPHQVMREFWRNRVSVLGSRGAGTEQALNALDKQQRAAADALHQWAKTTAIEASERDALIDKITTLYSELEQIIQTHAPGTPTMVGSASDEPVLRELEALLDRKVGAAPDEIDRQATVDEGNARVSRRQPPGYLDAEKIDSTLPEGAAGDYLVASDTS